MAYDHARKAGNLADVWKHFTLLTVLADLVIEADTAAHPFTYLDSHCGEGRYPLAPDGEWREGIGRVLPVPKCLAGHPYFAAVGDDVATGTAYRGSWRLVADYLGRRGCPTRLFLYDTDLEVARRLGAVDDVPGGLSVRFTHADGYQAVVHSGGWQLVLIDPPYHPDLDRELERVATASQSLAHRQIPFLIWYPVVDAPGSGRPGPGVGYELLWGPGSKPWQRGLIGCGMLAGGRAIRSLAAHADAFTTLAAHVGAELGIRTAP